MIQGVMYAAAMMLIYIPTLIVAFIPGYISLMQAYMLTSLQGFYNAFTYSGALQK